MSSGKFLSKCSQCGEDSYENLSEHGYCVNCDFSKEVDGEDRDRSIFQDLSLLLKGRVNFSTHNFDFSGVY